MIPAFLLNATRWQALSTLPGGGTFYETREVYAGALATTLEALLGAGLQEGFDAQAAALKARVEGMQ